MSELNDDDFLTYCENHVKNPRPVFPGAHLTRLYELAGAGSGTITVYPDGKMFTVVTPLVQDLIKQARELRKVHAAEFMDGLGESVAAPIPMILYCPRCHWLHIDEPDPATGWLNPPHRSHLCAGCHLIWRPADVFTTGVKVLQTKGKEDVEAYSHWEQYHVVG